MGGWLLAGTGPAIAYLEIAPPIVGFYVFLAGLLAAVSGVVGGLWQLRKSESRKWGAIAAATGFVQVMLVLGMSSLGSDAPPINDVTTDLENPVEFHHASELDGLDGEDLSYPDDFKPIVEESYPDLEPLVLNYPRDLVFAAVKDVAAERWHEVTWSLEDAEASWLEGVNQTDLFKFKDDIAVRLTDTKDGGTRVDVRSRSRVGKGDLGANAERIDAFLDTLEATLEDQMQMVRELQ